MKIINKILIKNDSPKYKNYKELINFAYPYLFTIEQDDKLKIGFVNIYAPTRGEISFILTDVENITNIKNKSIRNLFENKIVEKCYYYRGKFTKSILTKKELEKYLPHKDLLF